LVNNWQRYGQKESGTIFMTQGAITAYELFGMLMILLVKRINCSVCFHPTLVSFRVSGALRIYWSFECLFSFP